MGMSSLAEALSGEVFLYRRVLASSVKYSRDQFELAVHEKHGSFWNGVNYFLQRAVEAFVISQKHPAPFVQSYGAEEFQENLQASFSNYLDFECQNDQVLGPKGTIALVKILLQNPIEHLSLRRCNVRDEGALALAEALPETRLITVDLSANHLTDKVLPAFLKHKSRNLLHLNMMSNRLKGAACRDLNKQLPDVNILCSKLFWPPSIVDAMDWLGDQLTVVDDKEVVAGTVVEVLEAFMGNSKDNKVELPEGAMGHVEKISAKTDSAFINFQGMGKQWVKKDDFPKLITLEKVRDPGEK